MSKARTLANTVSTGGSLETPDAIPASDISGLSTVATSGSYNDLSNKPTTIATANDLSGGVTGAVPYQAGVGDTAMLSPGTSGQVLTSGGSGAAPSWATPSGGSWVYLSTVTASSSSTVDIETTFDSTYDTYVIVASDVTVSSNGTVLGMRWKIGGAYLSGADYNHYSLFSTSTAVTVVGGNDNGNTRIRVINSQGSAAGGVANFTIYFGPTSGTTNYKQAYWTGTFTTDAGATRTAHGSGAVTGNTGALTGVRFLPDSGNIASGTFRLYGIKKN
jgi:hypothetical protein